MLTLLIETHEDKTDTKCPVIKTEVISDDSKNGLQK